MRARDRIFLAGLAIGLIALAIALFTRGGDLAFVSRGWLVAFAIWSSVPIGAVALLLIHALTGGAWGYALAPVLRPAAALAPLVVVAFAPIALSTTAIYPWAARPAVVAHDVARFYLDPWLFDARAAIALIGLSALGVLAALGRLSPLAAGLGLAFFGVAISFGAIDWFLSVEAPATSTSFAAMIAFQDILAALALAGLVLAPTLEASDAGDLGGLLIATMLGVVYIELMQFVVDWYGDLPARVRWYVEREAAPWPDLLIAAIVCAILAFAALLAGRRKPLGLQVASGLLLVASIAHLAWIVSPAFHPAGPAALAGAVIAIVLCLVTAPLGVAARARLEARHAER